MASPRATAVFLLAALIVYAAVYPDTHLPLLALLTLGWGIATLHLCTPAKAPSEARLEKALQSVHKPPGLSDAWWEQQWSQIASLRMVAYLVVLGASAVLLLVAWPRSLAEMLGDFLQSGWSRMLGQGLDPRVLFVLGTFGVHFVVFWTICLLCTVLEFARPAALEPYKVQPEARLTVAVFAKAALVALGNEAILLAVVGAMAHCAPQLLDAALAAELPSLVEAALQLGLCVPVSEVLFYFGHRLMHVRWMFEHVHWMHHSFHAPFALASVYAHPVEFIIANIPVVLGGPALGRPHLAVWALWAAAASWKIIEGHLGWHLPFIGSPEPHDFHHSLHGGRNLDNLGQLGVLDAVLGTDAEWKTAWQRRVDVRYDAPDYPVDKALAQDEDARERDGLARKPALDA